MTNNAGDTAPTWYVTLIGGLKRRGSWRVPRDMRTISVVGGANLDLTEAELPAGATLTKISLFGGVSLRVPADVDVVVEGFRIFGGVRVDAGVRSGPPARTLRVREYSLAGGVHVERS
jgi:predicted membrane protein